MLQQMLHVLAVELLECFIWCVIDQQIELFVSCVLDAGLVAAASSKVFFTMEIVAGELYGFSGFFDE